MSNLQKVAMAKTKETKNTCSSVTQIQQSPACLLSALSFLSLDRQYMWKFPYILIFLLDFILGFKLLKMQTLVCIRAVYKGGGVKNKPSFFPYMLDT